MLIENKVPIVNSRFSPYNQNMQSQLKTTDRLKIESLYRTFYAFFPQITVQLIIITYLALTTTGHLLLYFLLGPVTLIQALRSSLIGLHKKDFNWLLRNYAFLMSLSFLTVFLLSAAAFYIYQEFSIASAIGILFTFNIIGISAAATYSFAPVPRLQILYILSIAGVFPVSALLENSAFSDTICAMFVIMIIFFFAVSRNHAADLRRTYEAEARLISERRKLKKVIDSIPGFVAMSDSDGDWIESSQSFEALKNVASLIEQKTVFQKSHAESLVREIQWKSGVDENMSYIVSFARLTDPENAIVMSGVPINELKAAQREVETQRSKAEYSARLATLGEMAGGIAHEINNPLAIIVAAVFYLESTMQPGSPVTEKELDTLRKIASTSERISKIIKSLRHLSRQGENDPMSACSLRQILEDTLQLCRERFRNHDVELIVDPVPDVTFKGRSVQISQVLLNLLNNAFDAVSKSEMKTVHLSFQQNQKGITVKVFDTGHGVPTEIQSKVFEPFFTTKEVGEGTGLGLSVSRGIIQDHQGEIFLDSQPGATTFGFFLPWT